jgi:hypothetical protein
MSEQETFLFQEGKKLIEVVLTGRTAKKQKGRREILLHEIASADKEVGFSTWIKRDQLFSIGDTNETE